MNDKELKSFLGWVTAKFKLDNEDMLKEFMDTKTDEQIESLFSMFKEEVTKYKLGGKTDYVKMLNKIKNCCL